MSIFSHFSCDVLINIRNYTFSLLIHFACQYICMIFEVSTAEKTPMVVVKVVTLWRWRLYVPPPPKPLYRPASPHVVTAKKTATGDGVFRYIHESSLCGIMISVLATGPKGRGLEPGRGDVLLRAIKIRSTPSYLLRSDSAGGIAREFWWTSQEFRQPASSSHHGSSCSYHLGMNKRPVGGHGSET
jgi:hypothetical protein